MSDRDRDHLLEQSVVTEVRAIREAIDEEVDHDIDKLAERASRIGKEYRRTHGLEPAAVPPKDFSSDDEAAVG